MKPGFMLANRNIGGLNVVKKAVEKIRVWAVVQLQARANVGPISCVIIINLTYKVFKISLFNQRSMK